MLAAFVSSFFQDPEVFVYKEMLVMLEPETMQAKVISSEVWSVLGETSVTEGFYFPFFCLAVGVAVAFGVCVGGGAGGGGGERFIIFLILWFQKSTM